MKILLAVILILLFTCTEYYNAINVITLSNMRHNCVKYISELSVTYASSNFIYIYVYNGKKKLKTSKLPISVDKSYKIIESNVKSDKITESVSKSDKIIESVVKSDKIIESVSKSDEISTSVSKSDLSSVSTISSKISTELTKNETPELKPDKTSHLLKESHSKFYDFILDYNKWITKSYQDGTAYNRYLVFQPNDQGLGNKMNGFLSVIFWAMLNKRVIFIGEWPVFYTIFDSEVHIPIIRKQNNTLNKERIYRHCGHRGFPELYTISLDNSTDENYNMQSNCRLVEYFMRNPNLYLRLQEIGLMDKSNHTIMKEVDVYHYLVNQYLKPSELIKSKVNEIFKPWSRYHVIGMHARLGDRTSFGWTPTGRYVPVDKNATFEKNGRVNNILRKMKELTHDNTNTKWFVVTDSQVFKDRMIEEYKDRIVYYQADIGHTGARGHLIESKMLIDTVIELFLLAQCDERVVTTVSSFGQMAAMITNKPSYILVG